MKHSRHGIGCAMRCAWLKKKRVTGHGMGLDFFGRARIGETRSRFGSWVVLSWRAPEIERPSKNGREILVKFLSDSEVDFPRIATKNGARVWAEDWWLKASKMALPLHQSTLKLYQIPQHQNTKGRASMNQAWHDVQLLCLNCSFFLFFLGCPTLQQFLLFVFSRKNKELTKNQVQKKWCHQTRSKHRDAISGVQFLRWSRASLPWRRRWYRLGYDGF